MRIVLLSVASLCSSPVLASENVATTTTTPTPAEPADGERAEKSKPTKICRYVEPAVGRVGAKKICLTNEEWKKRRSEEM